MHEVLNGVYIRGVVRSGQIYVFADFEDRGWSPEPLDWLYVIQWDADILPALDLELWALSELYEFKEYAGCEKRSDDCYEFRFSCLRKPEGTTKMYSIFLQRVMNCQEKLLKTRRC